MAQAPHFPFYSRRQDTYSFWILKRSITYHLSIMKSNKNQAKDSKQFLIILLLFIFCMLFKVACATDKKSPQPQKDSTSTKILPVKEVSPSLKFSGYFDTYFFANLNNPSTRNNLGSSGSARGFDRFSNQFQLGMFLTQINYTNKNVEFVGEVGYGPNMQYASYGSDFRYKWGTVVASNTYTAIFIKQAYIKLKASKKLSFVMGQFGTHIGYEYIDAPLNFHYSISNTFNSGIPFYHVGLKATYAFSDKISLMGGVVNGTDNINSNNGSMKFIGQVLVTPREGLELSLNTIQGNEANSRTNGKDTTSYFGVLDFVANYQVNQKVKLGFWAMYGSQQGEFQGGTYFAQMRHWSGVSLYTQIKINKDFAVGTRLEHFDNTEGVRPLLTNGLGTYVDTFTLTGSFQLSDGALTLKPELRFDSFEKMKGPNGEQMVQQFADRNGNFTKNNQTTIGMAAILKF